MTPIFPVTALQKNSSEVREAAREQIVHITENGRASFVFASEETFDEYIAEQRADAAREALLFQAIDRGEQDVADGRLHTADSVDDLFALLDDSLEPHRGDTAA